jgi:DNA-binding transcriptional LysR family regulator
MMKAVAMPNLDPDHLRTFAAIADTGSFTRAADTVAKTQSAVSMQMRRLEERVGKPLFERDGRASRLTADGERLLPYARRILKLHAETMAVFEENPESGTVRLGMPDDYAAFLPEILGRFAASRPLVEISLVCSPTPMLIEALAGDELDIAIITHVPAKGRPAPLIVRREPLVWVTSERFAVHEETPLPLALGSMFCDWRRAAVAALEAIGRDHRIAFSSWNFAAVSAAVHGGLAVSVLPASAVTKGMRVLGEDDGFPHLPVCEIGVLRGPNGNTQLADALVEHVIAGLGARETRTAAAA